MRKKKNPSGVVSVQVIDKSSGKYKVLKTIGSSAIISEINSLLLEAEHWVKQQTGVQEFDFTDYQTHTDLVLEGIDQITVVGPELFLGKLFDEIGFSQIQDELFRKLVIARLCFPASKLKTTDYLSKYQFFDVDVQKVYRYLDKLNKNQKEHIQQISYEHTLTILQGRISAVFYDVTTLYFEIDKEDELRKRGFSKEGKHQNPQVVLGLLVSRGGYPLAYDIFKGNQFEGHTMLPILESFKKKYKLDQLIVVADAGLLSKDNIRKLRDNGYEYVLGARIKTEKDTVKKKILALELKNGESALIEKDKNTKLIITYSDIRAKKDAKNRERGLERLIKKIKSGKLTKQSINNKGYNKFLQLEGEVQISIDKQKIEKDKQWDGLKGYYTNTTLDNKEVIAHYRDLWQIEKAFRVSKSDLGIRPIYHRLSRRIEAHVCIAFTAYKIYMELDRQLKEKKSELSPEKAIDIAKTIFQIKIIHPLTKKVTFKTFIKTKQQKDLNEMFNLIRVSQ